MNKYKCTQCGYDSDSAPQPLGRKLVEMVRSGQIKPGDHVRCPSCSAEIQNPRALFITRYDVSSVSEEDHSSSLYGERSVPPLRAIVLCPGCRGVFVDAPALPKNAECSSCHTKFCLERGHVLWCPSCGSHLMLPENPMDMDPIYRFISFNVPGTEGKWPVKCTLCNFDYLATP